MRYSLLKVKTGNPLKLKFSVFFLVFFGLNTLAYTNDEVRKDEFIIVLDAGHGGKDTGTRGNGYLEKKIALALVLNVGESLGKHQDIKVIYTRTTDEFVTLKDRADKANKAKADLFVSVHLNASGSTQPHGAETFVLGTHRNKDNFEIAKKENSVIYLEDDYEETYDGFDPESPTSYISMELMQEEYLDQSILLADYVQDEFTSKLKRYDRGVKKAGFLVLRETYMPSVLIETGFLTNANEGRYLNSQKGQKEMASSIAEGLVRYKELLESNDTDIALDAEQIEEEIDQRGKKEQEGDVVYRVQIGAGAQPMETAAYNFKGLEGVERDKEGELYKYYYGSTSDYKEIKNIKKEVEGKGFDNSFIVAFENGNKLDVDEEDIKEELE